MTDFGLEQHILDKIREVLRQHAGIERAVIFGSRATASYKPHSDIDLAIYAANVSDEEFARLRFEIGELPLVFTIDVVRADTLGEGGLKEKISREGISIYPVG
jgi:uncharacterized protein